MKAQLFTDEELQAFHEGRNFSCHRILGAHLTEYANMPGVRFAVWAPHAAAVRVVGEFNRWQGDGWQMARQGNPVFGRCLYPACLQVNYINTKLLLRQAAC